MRRVTGLLGVMAVGAVLAGCGTTQEQRTATGGLLGVGAGAAIGGPFGAAIGLAAGAIGGALMPEDATTIANDLLGREHRAAASAIGMPSQPQPAASAAGQGYAPTGATGTTGTSTAPDTIKSAQAKLKDDGYYHGNVDGIVGPKTRSALRHYQRDQGLNQTAKLDRDTLARLNGETAPPASGSTAPPPPSAYPPSPAPPPGPQQQ